MIQTICKKSTLFFDHPDDPDNLQNLTVLFDHLDEPDDLQKYDRPLCTKTARNDNLVHKQKTLYEMLSLCTRNIFSSHKSILFVLEATYLIILAAWSITLLISK